MSKVLDSLRAAAAIVGDPDRWTTHHSARDRFGFYTDPKGGAAVRFCALGAIVHVCGDDFLLEDKCLKRLRKASTALFGQQLFMLYNDCEMFGRSAMENMFARAIEELEAEEDAAAEREGAEIIRLLTNESVYPEANYEVACAV